MKKLIGLFLLLGFVTPGVAQRARQVSPLQAMVEAEIAFAKMSEEQGVRPSFMAFIADDGILFRPKAVKGKKWMSENPVPPSDKRPLLKWYPSHAEMDRAGDMGYTFGPWEFKNDIKDPKPAGFGHFLTVWKRQADGSWKFAVDLGISHPEPTAPEPLWELPKNYKKPLTGRLAKVESERAALLARERAFATAMATPGAQMASLLETFADNVRVFREGKMPSLGRFAAAEGLAPGAGTKATWHAEFADVSSSGDLGYSYGTYQLTHPGAPQPIETGNYLRVWKKQNGVWMVIVDLANPIAAQ